MKYLLVISLLYTFAFSNALELSSFEADFLQTISDEKGDTLTYSGTLKAQKPQYALWNYEKPVQKSVYIENSSISIVEPELEQVIIRRISSDFDFFTLVSNAKKIDKNHYETNFEESKVLITLKESKIFSLSYKDKFDNDVKILFSNQKQNREFSKDIFRVSYPKSYDLIVE